MSGASPAVIIGASVPRSGHHFLSQTLAGYWGRDLHYCQWYGEAECCRAVPCTRTGPFSVSFQKSHDWDMALPRDVPGATYVVQYRHPVPAALSDWERGSRERLDNVAPDYRRSRANFAWYLAKKAHYFRRFHDKWLAVRSPGTVLLEYDAFRADPAASLAPVIRAAVGHVDEARLAETVAASSRVQAASGRPFQARVVESGAMPHPDLVAAFEAHVLGTCPHYGFARQLCGDGARDEFQGLTLVADPGLPFQGGIGDRLATADRLSGGHPEVRLARAENEAKAGDAAAAAALLEATVQSKPDFLPAWRLLLRLSRKEGIPLRAGLITAEAMFNAIGDAELLARFGQAWADDGQRVKALAAFTLASGMNPTRARLRTGRASLLAKLGRGEEARAEAMAALALDPDDATARRIAAKAELAEPLPAEAP